MKAVDLRNLKSKTIDKWMNNQRMAEAQQRGDYL
jgi:hypothetical protein